MLGASCCWTCVPVDRFPLSKKISAVARRCFCLHRWGWRATVQVQMLVLCTTWEMTRCRHAVGAWPSFQFYQLDWLRIAPRQI